MRLALRTRRPTAYATDIVVSVFVFVVGALGYIYVTRLNSQMASTRTNSPSTSKTNTAHTTTQRATMPSATASQQAVTATDELDRLTATLDQTAVDDSSTDLDALTQAVASF